MTYCVGLKLERGLVLASDTRTNAGLDNIASFTKMHVWERPGDRVLVLLSAGNLSISQSIINELGTSLDKVAEERPTLSTAEDMFQAARVIGEAIRRVYEIEGKALEQRAEAFIASFIFAGQIRGDSARLFQIYSEGNFIEATNDKPFFQIGEHKYGKPILDRVAGKDMRLGDAAKLLLVSFDSTLRSNLSVGMPIDLMVYQKDSLKITRQKRIEDNDEYFSGLSADWGNALKSAFESLPDFEI